MESELDRYLDEAPPSQWRGANPSDLTIAKEIVSASPDRKAETAVEIVRRLRTVAADLAGKHVLSSEDRTWRVAYLLTSLLRTLMRSELPLQEQGLRELLDYAAAGASSRIVWIQLPVAGVLRTAERYTREKSLTIAHVAALNQLLDSPMLERSTLDGRKLSDRVRAMLGKSVPVPDALIEAGEPWADRALEDLTTLDNLSSWNDLLKLAKTASTSKPTRSWVRRAGELIQSIGVSVFVRVVDEWSGLVGQPGVGRPMRGYVGTVLDPTVIGESNADILKGLAWSAGASGDPSASRMLGNLAEVCFKKIPVHGARCPRVGNACLAALNLLPGQEPVGELVRLRARVKQPSIRAAVEKAIAKAAQNLGMSREEVEEISTPSVGLGADGALRRSIGSFSAEIAIVGTRDVAMRWTGSNGKTVKSVPAEVKRDHADALKDLQRIRKDIERTLPAQAERIERLLVDQRDWPIDTWRERYLEHPLLGQLCRRLIWQLVDLPAVQFIWLNNALVGSDDKVVDLPAGSRVRLWHPIGSPPAEIQRWRSFLEQYGVTQPFKQAHRELYLLTDAEEQTVTYSNRFAAHVLRQHQFAALCQARGWRYRLMGAFDSHNTPTLDLPRHNLRAEFWVEQPHNDELSHAGINLRITTDQVRFHRAGANEPMPLAQVPALLFSEIMRDVDLFVGVASVGNDPTWQDGGPEGRYRTYWQSYSFGELSATAQTRRAVLESLLPRLTKIRDRCQLSDRFLIVRGEIRTYKIHLGSGNILMEPNDQYLCIVPSRSTDGGAADVFLPFEGDATLSIILSKAFLLAEDKKIKDATITRQIGK